jgi:broad specificity phosphatase PhoE
MVRHADTEFTERRLLHGSLDSPLSHAGQTQARRTAERLSGEEFEGLYSSPLGRSLTTAAVIGDAIGLQPIPEPGLAERDFGWMEGRPLPKRDANAIVWRAYQLLVRASFALSGEGLREFEARVADALHAILSRHPRDRVTLVTHWGVLSMIMHQLLGGDRREWLRSANWGPCSITEVTRSNGEWEPVRVNDRGHLADEG